MQSMMHVRCTTMLYILLSYHIGGEIPRFFGDDYQGANQEKGNTGMFRRIQKRMINSITLLYTDRRIRKNGSGSF